MPSYDPELFNVDPYYDDYDQDKKFLKMLFRPGYALQARELTQLQSILQNQIERFGNFVFDDGSIVYGGQITEIPTKTAYLQSLTGAGASPEDLNDILIEIQNGGTTGFAKIIYGMTESRTDGDYDVIFYQQVSGAGLTQGSIRGTLGGLTFTATMTGNVEDSLVVFVDEGIRYTNGYFVMNNSQRLGLFERDLENPDSYTYQNVSSSVGFNIEKSIVTSEEDPTLKDPANGSYNFNAPGADRFKIDLIISQRSLTATEETVATDPFTRTNFIEFLRVFEGNVVKKDKYADLGALEDTLARRTYDESGNYVVDPFDLSVIPHPSDDGKLYAKLDSGKAYIFGYEFETQGSVIKPFNKARGSNHVSDEVGLELNREIGPYVLVKFHGISGSAAGLSFGGQSAYYPTVFFDSRSGYPVDQEFSSGFDGVRFQINYLPNINTFTPGLTLYISSNADMGENGTADAEVLGTISSVETFSGGPTSSPTFYTKIEVVPPYELGMTAISQGLSFPDGLTSVFTTYETFYISGGTGFEAGLTSQVFPVSRNSVSFFQTLSIGALTGGSFGEIIGNAKIKNVQRLSGEIYKMLLGDINLYSGRSISEIKRYYLGGSEPNSYRSEPVFFSYETPTNIYDTSGESLVFYSNFDDEIERFTNSNFAIDVTRVFNSLSDIDSSGNGFNGGQFYKITFGSGYLPLGSQQWALNFSSNEVPVSLQNTNFITVFDLDGSIPGNYVVSNGPGGESTNPQILELYLEREPKWPLTLITSHIVDPFGESSSYRRKSLIEVSLDESSTPAPLTFFSGEGEDEGYWVSYVKRTGNTFETDIYEVTSFTKDGTNIPFELDSGQKDSYYDFSRIKIKKSADILAGSPPSVELATYDIAYRKFAHDTGNGPFIGGKEGNNRAYYLSGSDIDSLSTFPSYTTPMPFELIPSFTTKDGEIINLRNAIDFRPVRTGNTDTFSLRGPYDDATNELYSSHMFNGYDNSIEYKHFLPRIDKIFLNKNKTFSLVEGIPSNNPQAPSDNPDSMTLYSIVVNPYTFDENDVTIKQDNNRRYTMKDIGELEKRIEKIEYYSTLNSLELEAKSHPIYDSYGIEMPKKAVLVDQFSNANSADVLNEDYTMSIDKEKKELKPNFDIYELPAITDAGGLTSSISIGEGLTFDSSSRVVTLNYTLTPYLENSSANSSRKINSNSLINYNGSLKVTPHCDKWFSTSVSPVVKTNFDGENDHWYSQTPFNRISNFWDQNWFGKESTSIDKNFKKSLPKRSYNQRNQPIGKNKIGSFFSAESNSFSYNQKIVERSITPYVRSRTLNVEAKGLKPNTPHYVYFDNVLQTIGGGVQTITTDDYGEVSFTLTPLGNTYLAGKKLIRITDAQISNSEDPSNVSNSTSSADAIYTVLGNVRDQESQQFIKPLLTKREASDSPNITTNAVTRNFQRSEIKSRNVKDSLTQIFSVDYSTYKSGLYVKQIDVYLDGYPTSASTAIGSSVSSKLPIRLQLKPVVSGYPNISKVIAESYVYDVDDISNSNVETITNFSEDINQVKKVKFIFDYPVYLPPGDYAFSLDSNSDEYSVVTYILPSIQKDDQRSNKNSAISSLFGSLFLPKNIGNFEKITNEFITTSIHRCNFSTSNSSITATLAPSPITINDFRLNLDYIEPIPNSLDVRLGNLSGEKITPNKTIEFNESTSQVTITLNSSLSSVSPSVDLNSMDMIYTKYKLPSVDLANEEKPKYTGSDPSDGSRYISKTINLDVPARNVVVRFDKIEPPDTDISVFLRYKTPGAELGLSQIGYVRLVPVTNSGLKTATNTFITDEYTYPGSLPEIASFSVKIVYNSTFGTEVKKYPIIKNLTITAV